jgi:hypothetical protein
LQRTGRKVVAECFQVRDSRVGRLLRHRAVTVAKQRNRKDAGILYACPTSFAAFDGLDNLTGYRPSFGARDLRLCGELRGECFRRVRRPKHFVGETALRFFGVVRVFELNERISLGRYKLLQRLQLLPLVADIPDDCVVRVRGASGGAVLFEIFVVLRHRSISVRVRSAAGRRAHFFIAELGKLGLFQSVRALLFEFCLPERFFGDDLTAGDAGRDRLRNAGNASAFGLPAKAAKLRLRRRGLGASGELGFLKLSSARNPGTGAGLLCGLFAKEDVAARDGAAHGGLCGELFGRLLLCPAFDAGLFGSRGRFEASALGSRQAAVACKSRELFVESVTFAPSGDRTADTAGDTLRGRKTADLTNTRLQARPTS